MKRSESQTIRCLITAGPTREFFDPVRFISNPSSGKMGYAIANAAARRGWSVDLVSGPVSLPIEDSVKRCQVTTGNEMLEACLGPFSFCDVLIMTAAVTDMRPKHCFEQKQKKDQIEATVEFEPVVDILKTLSEQRTHQLLVGFAAETEKVYEHALKKLKEKNLDWIVANDVSIEGSGFESDRNQVQMVSRDETAHRYGPDSKDQIAEWILEHLCEHSRLQSDLELSQS